MPDHAPLSAADLATIRAATGSLMADPNTLELPSGQARAGVVLLYLERLLAAAEREAKLREAASIAAGALNDCPFIDPLRRRNQHMVALGAVRKVLYPPKEPAP